MLITGRRTRALVRAFSLVMATVSAVLAGAVAGLAGSAAWPAWAAAFFFGVAMVGWLNASLARKALASYDRLADRVARFARLVLTGAAFAIIALAGRAGSRLPWKPRLPDGSGWVPRPTALPDAFESQSTLQARERGWVPNLTGWAGRSGNVWIWALLPPLLLLSRIQLSNRRSLGGATYTLY